MQHFRVAIAALTAGLGSAAACSESLYDDDEPASLGRYTLRSVDGNAVPANAVQTPTYTLRIISGSLTLEPNFAFTATSTFEETNAGVPKTVSSTCSGTYTVHPTFPNTTFSFDEANSADPSCGSNYSGIWNGSNRLTVSFDSFDPGLVALFER